MWFCTIFISNFITPLCAWQMVLCNCCIFWYLDFFNVLEGVMMHSCVLSQDLNYYILQSTLLFMVAIFDNAEGLEVRVTACRPELTLQSWLRYLYVSGSIDVKSHFGIKWKHSSFTKALPKLIHFSETRITDITLQ